MAKASEELLASLWGLFARSVGELCGLAEKQGSGVHFENLRAVNGKDKVLIACFVGKPAFVGPVMRLLRSQPTVIPNWKHANVGRLALKTINGSGFGYYASPTGHRESALMIAAEPHSISLLESALNVKN